MPLEAADTLEKGFDAGGREHSRRLVQNEQLGVGDQRASDLHSLLDLDRQVADAPARIDIEIEDREPFAASLQDLTTAVEADALAGAELQRLRHGEGGRQREALVHQLDARRARTGHTAETQRAPVDGEGPCIGADKSGRDTGECRLARAVLANHGVDGAAREGDFEIGERRHLAVCDANPAAMKGRRVRDGHLFRERLLVRACLQSSVLNGTETEPSRMPARAASTAGHASSDRATIAAGPCSW